LSFFELLAAYPQYRGLQQIARSYEDLIAQIIEDKSADNEDSLEFYRAQEEFAKKQKAELDNIVSLWESLAQEDDLPGLQAGLQSLVEKVETTIDNNPFQAQVEDEETCSENQEVCRLYQSWPQAFTSQLTAAVVLKNRAGVLDPSQPDFDQKLDSLLALIDQKTKSTQDSLENLEQQISAYSSIIEELEDLYDLTLEELNNPDLVTLLKTYFKEIFGDNKKYYYIPSGTKYQVCLQPLPMRPGFEDIVSESPPTLVYGSSGFFNSSYCPAVNQPLSTP
jgi:hypothetical protein